MFFHVGTSSSAPVGKYLFSGASSLHIASPAAQRFKPFLGGSAHLVVRSPLEWVDGLADLSGQNPKGMKEPPPDLQMEKVAAEIAWEKVENAVPMDQFLRPKSLPKGTYGDWQCRLRSIDFRWVYVVKGVEVVTDETVVPE